MVDGKNDGYSDAEGFHPGISLRQVLDHRRVVLTAHVDPDPDALGSALGLHNVLSREGWDTVPVCIGNVPSFAPFLPGSELLTQFPSQPTLAADQRPILRPGDALVVMDTPTATRMAAFYELHSEIMRECQVVVFDHHYTNDRFGTVNFVDPKASSTVEVVCDVLDSEAMGIGSRAATCFMTALLADTQTFRTENTSPRSLLRGYRLADEGAPIFELTQLLFKTRPISGLKLWGSAIQRTQVGDQYLWTIVSQDMLAESGATIEEAEGLVDFLLGTRDTRAAVVFKEDPPGETKASMRTVPGVDATRVAAVFGGGGHQRAAACSIEAMPEEAARRLLPHLVHELGATAQIS